MKKNIIKICGVSAVFAVCSVSVVAAYLCWELDNRSCGKRLLSEEVLAGTATCEAEGGTYAIAYLKTYTSGSGYSQSTPYEATCSWYCQATDGAGQGRRIKKQRKAGGKGWQMA